ncbi:MAG: 30S ribosome-binding factor RbfA [Gemmatimonadota bacterium]
MAGRRRVERLNELLRQELSRLIRREIKDPRVGSVTVTGVRTSVDLMYATVYVRTLGGETPVADAVRGLERAEGFIRRRLGRELRLRRIPELRFEEDRTIEHARRIETLLGEALGSTDPDERDAG